jgi:nickel-dependent lactate racemase
MHDPANRKRLSYLATTRAGRRIYLNRTVVDADQLVVMTRRRYDPLLGYSGAEGALYPALSDEATRQDVWEHLSTAAPGKKPWPARKEAGEVAWLLGVPFFLQVIEGAGDDFAHIIGGTTDTGDEGIRLLNANWRVSVDRLADLVVAGIAGDANRHSFADLAAALAAAARVVKPQGRIVLLTQASPPLGEGADLLREASDPEQALDLLRSQSPSDIAAAYLWACAAQRATIYLLSGLPGEVAEGLFTTPLKDAGQVQRLVDSPGTCLFVPDAHKTLAVPPRALES